MRFPPIALQVPRVLLPRAGVPLDTWAVIACDQHTSDPGYWSAVAGRVGDAPSTLRLVLPEVFLEAADRAERIERIRRTMDEYLAQGTLQELAPGFVLVDRQTPHAASRKGLLVALDLERYSYAADARTLIRTTEGTVLERLPPRIAIRRGAPLEVPHTLVLIDDPGGTVIEPLFEDRLPALYDLELMLGGGRLRGWHVAGAAAIRQTADALTRLAAPAALAARYGADLADPPLLYAMGDGNHSFAAARDVWQEVKGGGGLAAVADHPARHALVELVNLHDDGLRFEPIHRVLFDVDAAALLAAMADFYRAQGSPAAVEEFADGEGWQRARSDLDERRDHHIPYIAGRAGGPPRRGILTIRDPRHRLEAVCLQQFLSGYAGPGRRLEVDYIHGADAVERLGSRPGNVGLFSQVLDKRDLFRTIQLEGPLPRKSFSLGEAEEKRYYLECRRIAG